MPPAPTLDGRMICVCNCCYFIDGSGVLPDAAEPYRGGAGFTAPPKTFRAGNLDIDACLVGTTADGVVLAFRGTLELDFHDHASLRDWMNSITAKPVRPEWLPADSAARVHEGFLASLEDLGNLGALVEAVNQLQAAGPGMKLLITGHSKGGACAVLAALRLWTTDQIPSQVFTFAAPRAGDRAFADVYNNAHVIHRRYEFQDDLVPHMPPTIGGIVDQLAKIPWIGGNFSGVQLYDYESVGALRFIDWSNQIEADSTQLAVQRDWKLAWVIWRARFDQLRGDHEIKCKQQPGYMSVVCPDGVCPRG